MKIIDEKRLEDLIAQSLGLDCNLDQQLAAIQELARVRHPKAYAFFDELVRVDVAESKLNDHDYDKMYEYALDCDFRIPYPWEMHTVSLHATGELGKVVVQEFARKETKERQGDVDCIYLEPEPVTERARKIKEIIANSKYISDQTRQFSPYNPIEDTSDFVGVIRTSVAGIEHTAINSLGRFKYHTTSLEDFVDSLAEALGVVLPCLAIYDGATKGNYLGKKGIKKVGNIEMVLEYEKHPVQEVLDSIKSVYGSPFQFPNAARALYETLIPTEETLYLTVGDKKASIVFFDSGDKVVEVFVNEQNEAVVRALVEKYPQATTIAPKKLDDKKYYLILNFGTKKSRAQFPIEYNTESLNALSFVKDYLSL